MRRIAQVEGQPVELLTIEELARAVRRSPTTVRRWERQGLIPGAAYRLRTSSSKGRRRLYTQAQVSAARAGAVTTGVGSAGRSAPVLVAKVGRVIRAAGP